jgi:hypothetical protein
LYQVELEVLKPRILQVYARTPEEAEDIASDIMLEEEGVGQDALTIQDVYPVDEESMGEVVRDTSTISGE